MASITGNEVGDAFLEGIQELFQIMFNDKKVLYCPMDTEKTKINIYEEAPQKYYLDGIPLSAKIVTTFTKEQLPVQDLKVDAIVTIATKELMDNNLMTFKLDNLKEMQKGKINYKDVEYLISYIQPKTLVGDIWQFFDFFCYVDKKER